MIDYKKAREFGTLELLAKQVVEGFITGLHKSPFHGFSVEFSEHRLYNSGESVKHLDWKLLAKTEKMFIKRYEEETNLRCHILIDGSSSMLYPNSQPYNKLSFSLDASASLIYLMRKQRDAFGLSIFSDKLDFYSQEKSSLTHQRFIFSNMEKIIEKKYNEVNKKSSDISEIINQLAIKINKRSLVFIFSDFMAIRDFEGLANAIKHLKFNQHEIVVFDVFHDQLENELNLANKYYSVVDMETGLKLKLHPKQIRNKFVERRKHLRNKLKNLFIGQKIDFISANIENGFDDILIQYLIKRKISTKKV